MTDARRIVAAQIITRRRTRLLVRDFRGWLRASEASFIVLAIGIGATAGLLSVILGALARTLQHLLFKLPPNTRLSGVAELGLASLIVLPLGGLIFAAFGYATRARKRRLVDAVEANALHGGVCRCLTAWLFQAKRFSRTVLGPRSGWKPPTRKWAGPWRRCSGIG